MNYKEIKDVPQGKKDCVVRAIHIATKIPYEEVHATLEVLGALEGTDGAAPRNGNYRRSHPDRGVSHATHLRYLKTLGWEYRKVPEGMLIDLLPHIGTIIINFHCHLATAIDGIIHDIWDCRKKRIIGYYKKKEN